MNKKIIQRNLSLDTKYILIDKTYIPLVDSTGTICDNCGKLIANIATIKQERTSKEFAIGFDCLETVLLNNSLLEGNIEEYKLYKKQLPSFITKAKKLKEDIDNSLNKIPIIELEFDITDFEKWRQYGKTSYITFYYVYENNYKYNSNIKLNNDILLNKFLEVLKVICKVNITTK